MLSYPSELVMLNSIVNTWLLARPKERLEPQGDQAGIQHSEGLCLEAAHRYDGLWGLGKGLLKG